MISNSRSRILLSTVLFVFIGTVSALAQRQDGTISGTVRDQSGGVVPGASVTATNENTGVARSTVSSDVGTYTIPNLLVGSYTVKVDVVGFKTYERQNVIVQAAQVVEVSPQLVVGGGTETIQVESGADLIQVQSSQLTKSFEARQIVDLPTVAGANTSVLNLSIFLPNTTTALGGTSGTGGSIGGLRGRQNSFTVDGVNNNDPQVTIASQQVIPDAVQEFSLSTNQFSAEFGNAAGGQFNVVTKRGTNDVHGGAWWYSNNRNLNARSNLTSPTDPKPRYDFNRAGGSVGGPVLKNRWFFFGAYEYQTRGQAALGTTATLPTADGLATLRSLAANDSVRSILGQFPTAPAQTGTTPVNLGGASTSIPVGNISLSAPDYFTQHDTIVNSDLALKTHSLRWGFLYTQRRAPSIPTLPQEQFIGMAGNDNHKYTFSDIWSINSRLVNEFRSSMSRLVSTASLEGLAAEFPNVQITGGLGIFVGPTNNYPQNRTTNQYQLLDQMNYVAGRHNLKWGGEYRWFTGSSVFLQNSRGFYNYTDLSNFLADQVPANQQLQGIGDGSFVGNASNVALFFQDDFRLRPRLTINAGVRYEYYGNPVGARRQALNSVSDLPGSPLIFRAPREDKNNFAPRVGFAWDIFGDGKWAVRGGGGVGYDVVPFNFITNGAPPQNSTVLTADSACAGQLAAPPAWCSGYLAGTGGANFLASGAMKLGFRPPSTQALARSLTNNIMADAVSPKVYSWSLGVQHEVMKDTVVEVRYLGTRAVELPVQIQLNTQTAFQRGARPLPTYFNASEIPATMPSTSPTLAEFLSARAFVYAAQGFPAAITTFKPVGTSIYHGGSVDVNRRFNRGLQWRGNYTWAKAIDNATNDLFTSVVNPRRPQDPANLDDERSRSTLDVRHKVALTWIYDVPRLSVENGLMRAVLHGWQVNGSYLYQSGQPITAQSGVDANGNRDAAGDRVILNPGGVGLTGSSVRFVCRGGSGATTVASSAAACGGNGSVVGYVSANPTARYIQAQAGALPNVGRNTIDTEPFNLWNLAVFKNNRISEGKSLQFRFEMYNAFNVGQYTLGAADVAPVLLTTRAQSPSYANVAAAQFLDHTQFDRQGRSIQLGLRLVF